MIKHWLVTGDTHGQNEIRLKNLKHQYPHFNPAETALIILGDSSFNYYCDSSDAARKRKLLYYGYTIYCVRGNHEERPENLGYSQIYDSNVKGNVYVDSINPNIRYFLDGGEYNLGGYSVLTIGGAYSIDKYHRLQTAAMQGSKFTGWFADEQLTPEEQQAILAKIKGKEYDFLLMHTCPYEWCPTDLFLPLINQTLVDNSMEKFLSKVVAEIEVCCAYCFGHYHADRSELERVEMYYKEIEPLERIDNRWHYYHGDEKDFALYVVKRAVGPKYKESK